MGLRRSWPTMGAFGLQNVSKMQKMPVSAMCMCALILRNAFVTMNGCNVATHHYILIVFPQH
jgi:hypothetical protein